MALPKDKNQFNQPVFVGDENPPGSIPSPTPSPTPPPEPTEPDPDDAADHARRRPLGEPLDHQPVALRDEIGPPPARAPCRGGPC